jgi:hypothetical protein
LAIQVLTALARKVRRYVNP